MILAIDPGPLTSGVLCVGEDGTFAGSDVVNDYVFALIKRNPTVIIEGMSFQGKMAGAEVLDTAFWIGRFYECALRWYTKTPVVIKRREVLRLLKCENDAQVRALMIEVYGPPKIKEVVTPTGKQGQPLKTKILTKQGPTYGVTGHAWQALGLYHAWKVQNGKE